MAEKSEDSEVSSGSESSNSDTNSTATLHSQKTLDSITTQNTQNPQVHHHFSEDEDYSDGYLATPIKNNKNNNRPRNSSGVSQFSQASIHTVKTPEEQEKLLDNNQPFTDCNSTENLLLSNSFSTIDSLAGTPTRSDLLRKCARKYSQNTPFDPILREGNLETMSLAQLKSRVGILESIIQDLNVNLVESLMRRDELRAEQDAKMTDLEDIQSLNTVLSKETTV